MICRKCGAKIKKGDTKCIYCGAVVSMYAGRRKNKASGANPKGRRSGSALFIVGALMIVIAIVTIAALKINDNKVLQKSNDNLVTLEKYFRSNDCEMMYRYISENNIYGSDFEKYTQIYEVYGHRRAALSAVKNINLYNSDTSADTFKYSIQTVMAECIIGIREANRYAFDYYELGNENMLKYLIQDFKKLLRDNLRLDSQTVEEMCDLTSVTEAALSTYVQEVYDNMKR